MFKAFIGDVYKAKSGAFKARLVKADGRVLTLRRCDTGAEFQVLPSELTACYENTYN